MILVVVVCGLGGKAIGFNIFPISTANGDQTNPSISVDNVVWSDTRDAKGDIYGYNISTQTEFAIITNGVAEAPDISNNLVVFKDSRAADPHGPQVIGYNLSTQSEFMVCPTGSKKGAPSIDGNIVVWDDKRNYYVPDGNTKHIWNVYSYDLSSQAEKRIAGSNTVPAFNSSISGNTAIWSDHRIEAHFPSLVIENLSSGSESIIVNFSVWSESGPDTAISGDIALFVDYRYGSDDIAGYNLSTQTEFIIARELGNQQNPDIDGDLVVWQDDRNGDWDIYGYDLLTHTEFPIATGIGDQLRPAISGNIVVWESDGDIYGAEIIPEPCTLLLIGIGGLLLRKRK